MFNMPKKSALTKAKPGPRADALEIGGGWRETVSNSFGVTKPAGGWPKAGE